MGREVVADDMHVQLGRNGLVDGDQKLLEFDCSMTTMQCGNDGAVVDIERRDSPEHYVQGGAPIFVTPDRT